MRQIIILILLSISIVGHAAPVTQAAATKKAKAFFALRKGLQARSPQLAMKCRQRIKGKEVITSTHPSYYVFNHGDSDGFIIISGDDQTPAILGYADSGSFDADNIPVNMAEWLSGYAQEIESVRAQQVKASSIEESDIARMVIAPLLRTKWGQDNPYNQQCFTTGGSQAATGCVATAIAQIMYYYQWPRSSTTAIPAYSSYEELPVTTFDWGNMQEGYNTKETTDDPHAQAVAKLLCYCGHAVKMSNGTSASSGSASTACTALPQYFGYGNTPKSVSRGSYTSTEWEELLYQELAHGRPVIYSGNSSSGTGHAFVCDGYDGSGFYHINWGWGGMSDGYFRLQALNPASQGTGGASSNYGYTNQQQMVVGISPKALSNEEVIADKRQIKVEELRLYDGVADTYDYTGSSFSNDSLYYAFRASVVGKYGLAFGLYRGDELLQTLTTSTAMNVTGTYTMHYTYAPSLSGLGANLSDGVYQIKCLYKPEGGTSWQKASNADAQYIKVTIANGKAIFAAVSESPQLVVTSVEQRFDITTRKKVRVGLLNNSDMDFEGFLSLAINNGTRSTEYVYMDRRSESFVDFVFSYSNSASVTLKVSVTNTSEVLYENKFSLTAAPQVSQPEVLSYEFRNLDKTNKKMYGNEAVATVTLKNTLTSTYEGEVMLTVNRLLEKKENGGVSYDYASSPTPITLIPGETKECIVTLPGYSAGDEIWFTLTCAGKSYTMGTAFDRYTVANGYAEWDGNGKMTAKALGSSVTVSEDAAAVSFMGVSLSGVTITPNSNPNTLYYLDAGVSTPSRLSGKNIIKGGQASGNISLQAGYAYYVPMAFDMSGTVSYTYTASASCDIRKGRQSITLPFAVKKATAGGATIDWNREEAATDKDFWVRRYQYVKGSTAYFVNTTEWLPNEPYLIGYPSKLKGKKIVQSATSSRVYKSTTSAIQGSGWQMTGTNSNRTLTNAYLLNSTGNAFIRSPKGQASADQVYFAPLVATTLSTLYIASDHLIGDVNGDGKVNVTDVMTLVNHVLGNTSSSFIEENADINCDDHITVTDVMAVVRIILGT